MSNNNNSEVWHDRKRTFLGLPLSFTRYGLLETKLTIRKGFLNLMDAEVMLQRIRDVTLHRKWWQRLFGIGTIHCCSNDKTMGNFNLENIKKPLMVKEMLSNMVALERKTNRVSIRENIIDEDDYEEEESQIEE